MFTPERHAGMTPDEDKMFGLCFNKTPVGGRAIDERWAAELDAPLQAAKDKGKPCNLELNSTSGATPLVIAALSNGTARVRVLLKHGMRLAAAVCVTLHYTLLLPQHVKAMLHAQHLLLHEPCCAAIMHRHELLLSLLRLNAWRPASFHHCASRCGSQ